jgi:uncharacterized protein (DUF1501 family)
MFLELVPLLDTWRSTPGSQGGSLADEVVLVVMSEMGRTPQLNGGAGKDHWGTTSVLLVGPNLTGNRVIGGYGEYFYGEPIDLGSGELSATGRLAAGGELGATLLTLAGADYREYLPDHLPVEGILT